MKNKKMILGIALIAVFVCSMTACSNGGKIVNSAEELKEYLDSLPANSPNKPIKVIMNAKDLVFPKISDAIMSSGKYVSLNLSGSPITTIPSESFYDRKTKKGCETLVRITIPNSVTTIDGAAFYGCTSLKNITIPTSVTSIGGSAFSNCTSLKSITIPDSVTSKRTQCTKYNPSNQIMPQNDQFVNLFDKKSVFFSNNSIFNSVPKKNNKKIMVKTGLTKEKNMVLLLVT